jgi:hypothetical protein
MLIKLSKRPVNNLVFFLVNDARISLIIQQQQNLQRLVRGGQYSGKRSGN